ncbi:hypothetical protein Tco_0884580 [Tanacetum coccineum]
MKKEGRQLSAVRTFPIFPTPLSQQRYVKNVDSASGTKVPRKPTNQQSNDKAKGTMKSMSVAYDHRMIECPSGASTADALAYLASYISYDDRDEYEGRNDEYEADYDQL